MTFKQTNLKTVGIENGYIVILLKDKTNHGVSAVRADVYIVTHAVSCSVPFKATFIYVASVTFKIVCRCFAETHNPTLEQAMLARKPPQTENLLPFALINIQKILNSLGLHAETTCHKHTG